VHLLFLVVLGGEDDELEGSDDMGAYFLRVVLDRGGVIFFPFQASQLLQNL